MNLYAIRDRMIDFYIEPPFFAPDDNNAMAAIAAAVNGEGTHAIVQAPHHFEIWKIGTFNGQTGDLVQQRELITECSRLIRRKGDDGRTAEMGPAPGSAGSPSSNAGGSRGTTNGTGPEHPEGTAPKGPENALRSPGA